MSQQLENFDVVFDPVLGRARAEGKKPESVVGGGGSSQTSSTVVQGGVQSVVAGTNITVDNTDPENPIVNSTATGGGSIPQYDTDPASPAAEDAWVLKSGSVTGGGKLQFLFGLGTPVTDSGTGGVTYQFSYRTQEGTTIRTTLS